MVEQRELPQTLGFLDCTTIVMGSMIGSGIFLKASGMAQILPDPRWLLAGWLFAGLLALCGALALAELGARFPGSGGVYVYLREVYGPLVAFLFGWSLLLILQSGSIAGLAAGIAESLGQFWELGTAARFWLSTGLVLGFTAINVVSVSLGVGLLQNLLTVFKGLGMLAIIALALTSSVGSADHLHEVGAMPTGLALVSALGVVMMKALWAYDGWVNVTFVAGEVKDVQRTLPRALWLGTGLVLLLYLLINLAYHYGLSLEDVQRSESVAISLIQKTSGTGAATAVGLLIMLSMAGTLNSSILSAPRVYFAMARDGLFFRAMGAIHPTFRTPALALWVQGLWSVVLLQAWGSFDKITDNVMFIFWIFYALGAGAIFLLPPPETTYRAPARKLTAGLFLLVSLFLTLNTLYQSPRESAQALVLVVGGLLVYPLFKSRSPRRASADR